MTKRSTPPAQPRKDAEVKPEVEVDPSVELLQRTGYRGTSHAGDETPATAAFQARLREIGWRVPATCVHDDETVAALKQYQSENGLQSTGNGTRETWVKLFS